tara:strand:- start:58 stop:1323 length:1266 start_codon:yes stop_codon:yes gene_type:complete
MLINHDKIFFSLLSILPISIIAGPTVSLINILLIVFLYFFVFIKKKHYIFLFKDKTIWLLLIVYVYLIFNSILSIDYEVGLNRNIGFIRLIFLFIGINYFFYISQKNLKVLKIWTAIIVIFATDVYFEKFLGTNIFGWGAEEINNIKQPHGKRVMSFFKDEPIAGAYLNGFVLLVCGYLLSIYKNKKGLYLPLIIIFLYFLFSIVVTGERSNSLKALFGMILFLSLIDFIKLKSKIIILFILILSFVLIISNSNYLKNRYFGQLYSEAFLEKDSKFFEENTYIKLYKSGFKVFKNYPFFGVGNKNYRVEACGDKAIELNYFCITHPHQVYFEFLAEHGLIGSTILLFIFFFLIFKNLKIMILSQNYVQIGSLLYLLSTFIPLLPSGSFFSDFNITLFFINFSLMYSVSKNTNIFFQKKNLQ